jgi:hypothetical protein
VVHCVENRTRQMARHKPLSCMKRKRYAYLFPIAMSRLMVLHTGSPVLPPTASSEPVTTGSAYPPTHFPLNSRGPIPYRAAKSRLNCDRCR